MNRNLCICLDFLTNAHKARIQTAAESAGFTQMCIRDSPKASTKKQNFHKTFLVWFLRTFNPVRWFW